MKDSSITVTPLALPKGGGALQGLGETFQAEAFTGVASFSLSLPLSPCRDFEPHLSLTYSSGAGNGIFGLGFQLSIPTITRKTSQGFPRYDDSDTFLFSSAEDLVPALNGERIETLNNLVYQVTTYLPRLEETFAVIEHWCAQTGSDSHWRVVDSENVTSLFGISAQTRSSDPADPSHIFQWLLEETFDAEGNYAIYEYASENTQNVPATLSEQNRSQTANKYIQRIAYGNAEPFQAGQTTPTTWHFEVLFDYGEYLIDPSNLTPYTPVRSWSNRPDSFSIYQTGFEIRTHRLCQHILLFHRFEELGAVPILVHATRLHYQTSPALSLLQAVESIGFRFEHGQYQSKSLPLLEFAYAPFQPGGHDFEPLQKEFLPGLSRLPEYQLVDLYSEGVPGILYNDGRTTLYWEPEQADDEQAGEPGVQYAPPQVPLSFPIDGSQQASINLHLLDLTGSGQLDLLIGTRTSTGYYEAKADHTWQPFRSFTFLPTAFSQPENYFVDMTGDGLADLVSLTDEQIYVYPSLGANGFGPAFIQQREQDLPFPQKSTPDEVIRFADLFGNGMAHLVRITNGQVVCWPHLGYGRFGPAVFFDNAPHFGVDFDASRLFLADLDGSGPADIIYVYPDHIEIFFNQSGNAFSDSLTIPLPCLWNQIQQIEFADIYGNGTTCMLLSQFIPQPRHWCYDFCQRQKPYFLTSLDNNLGAQTKMTYGSSTSEYLRDKKNDTPWIFALPFPVQVVKQIESLDLISQTRLVSTFTYHHGYYDGIEREFRGFGRIEQQDAETLLADAQPTDVPPVLTKTWYHTGAWQPSGSFTKQYEQEYYQGDSQAYLLPDSTCSLLAEDADALRDAARSFKGQILRQEVYALTAPLVSPGEQQNAPYTVMENNYSVKQLQLKGDNRYGVYTLSERETLTYDYERNPTDPVLHHDFILEVDAYNTVLRSCAVTYGRRPTIQEALPEQQSLKVSAEVNSFINQTEPDVHLLSIPQEEQSYEITGLTLATGQTCFTFEQVDAYLAQAIGTAAARLLDWQRHYYWSPSQKQPFPLGQVSPQALHTYTETAVFSPAQIEEAFAGTLSQDELEALLIEAGGYQLDSGQTYWWNPGLSEIFLDADQFFLPSSTLDPFRNKTVYTYDQHALLLSTVTDALNNQTIAQALDYQTLAPQQLLDFNGNTTEVLFDPLGMVIATSYYGTELGQAAGFRPLQDYQIQPVSSVDDIIAYPQTYLQGASNYFYYDLFAWNKQQMPVHTVSLLATTYPTSAPPPIQITLSYNDGFGRMQQTTSKVEPGEAQVIQSDGTITSVPITDRWLTSGRTVYNNKGQPVKQYEPYYIDTYRYIDNPHLNAFGVSQTLFYDPLERVIRIETPKGFFTRSEFTPWTETDYDEDDTVKDSPYYQKNINNQDPSFQMERQALQKAALFYNTPTTKVLDNLGRTIVEIQQVADTLLKTQYIWDIQGNQLASADSRLALAGLENFRRTYALTGAVLKTISADAGTSWQLQNVLGSPIYSKDSRNFEIRPSYDALHRLTTVHVQGGDGTVPLNQIVEKLIYGDSLDETGKPVVVDPEKLNLRGELYQHYDQAGLLQYSSYSLLEHPFQTSRQLLLDYKQEVNWDDTSAPTLATLLQPTIYQETARYDALGRLTALANADGNILEPIYHLSSRLNQIQVYPQADQPAEIYLQGISYNAKDQRQSISYGNGVTTNYVYEPTTFRLTNILTTRASDGKTLQDVTYTYDPVGNMTHLVDNAQEPVFNANQQVDPAADYTYDAIYRLLEATGREHPALTPPKERPGGFDPTWILPLQPVNNGQALQNYRQQFTYDLGSNLTSIQHQGATSWKRTLTVARTSNRAVEDAKAEEIDAYFDRNGNQTRMAGLQALAWNYRDNLASVMVIVRQNAPSDGEYYVYDSAGQRLRKVSEQYGSGGQVAHIEETIYLGSLEIKRITQGKQVVEERHSLRVMDDTQAIAQRITWTQGTPPTGVTSPQLRYQLENYLGSAILEVDAQAQIISYEEYFPYGETSLIAGRNASEVQLKQYRYSGKERDSVTGFYYYGARYYAPWLGRWLSPDPAGTVDGLNIYLFVGNNPINFPDIGGYAKKKTKKFGIKDVGGVYQVEGRPNFDTAARKIKVNRKQDRRHILGYADVLKPSYLKIANLVIAKRGRKWFIREQRKLLTQHKIQRAPKENAPVEKHLTFGLTKLNSTPGNLNPEAAHENQAIEHVRKQGLRLDKTITRAVLQNSDQLLGFGKIKKLLLEGFAMGKGGTDITDFANKIRQFTINRINNITQGDIEGLMAVLTTTITSTGIDLNKAAGSKAQTAFALEYISKVALATDPYAKMTDKERLAAVWNLLDIPK